MPISHNFPSPSKQLLRTALKTGALLALCTSFAVAQGSPAPASPSMGPSTTQTLYLNNADQRTENEIVTSLRNTLDPRTKMTLAPSQNAVVISGTPDQVDLARSILRDLDRPGRVYRLTYTILDMDGVKRIGEQHYSMITRSGQKTLLKQMSKVPITVSDSKDSDQKVTYIDVGMSFEATVSESQNGANLQTKVERSSIAEERSQLSQDPIIRATVFEGTSLLSPGKSLTLGSLDTPGSTRHIEIQVVLERMNQNGPA